MKIAPSNLQLGTYTNTKVKIIGSCNLYIIHPDTRCTTEVTFFVASNEGSILISCTTSISLGLIKPHASLDNSIPGSNVIFSSADKPRNDKSPCNVHMLWEKSKIKLKASTKKISNVYSNKEHSSTCSNKEQFHRGYSKRQQSKEEKNCQSIRYGKM